MRQLFFFFFLLIIKLSAQVLKNRIIIFKGANSDSVATFLNFFRPDINAIRGLPVVPGVPKGPAANVVRSTLDDRELPRQGSLADGEGIKIVIHDVDSDLGK